MISIAVEFANAEDAYLALRFLSRCSHEDFYLRTELALEPEERRERAYRMWDAIGRIENALRGAEALGGKSRRASPEHAI